MLTAPLYFGDEPLGQLLLIETELREALHRQDELQLVRALAEQAAVAIHNARLFRQQQRQNNRLVALADVSQALSASQDAEEILGMLLGAIPRLFPEWPITVDLWLRHDDVYLPFVCDGAADRQAAPRSCRASTKATATDPTATGTATGGPTAWSRRCCGTGRRPRTSITTRAAALSPP